MNPGRLAVVILGLIMLALVNLDLAYANTGTSSNSTTVNNSTSTNNDTVTSTAVSANNTGSKNATATTTEINTQSTTPNGAANLSQRGFNHISMIVAMVVVAMISVPRLENII